MAQTISIGSTQHIDLFKAKLGRQLKLCEGDGLKIYLEESPAGKYTFYSAGLLMIKASVPGRMSRAFSKYYLADVISDIILNHWEDPLLKEIIRENYYYFGEEERDIIFQYALRHINREGKDSQNTVYWLGRKNRIIQKSWITWMPTIGLILTGLFVSGSKTTSGNCAMPLKRLLTSF